MGGAPGGKQGALYDRLMEKVRTAIEGREVATVTFVWMQGERDARESQGEVYKASLEGLLDQLEQDLKREDIHFVLGRLSDFDMNDQKYPHWTRVREAQVEFAEADARRGWVDTDDLNKGTALHYSKEGYVTLGERFAAKGIELIKAD